MKSFTESWPQQASSVFYLVCSARYYARGGGKEHSGPRLAQPGGTMHGTYQSAKLEAERLARENPGERFIVMQAIGYAEVAPTPVVYKQL